MYIYIYTYVYICMYAYIYTHTQHVQDTMHMPTYGYADAAAKSRWHIQLKLLIEFNYI